MSVAPISFVPLPMERIWGGRLLEERYGKRLPPGVPIGESWEVVDRTEAQSVVADGPLAGRTLHELWSEERAAIFGRRAAGHGDRFPVLVKLLDARDTLSVQVHPPPEVAGRLGGCPKNELWVVTGAAPGACLYVGLRAGTTREVFTAALEAGEDVSGMLHRVDVQAGDAIFIPSGRVHAIGAGCLITEIQQNSDTTFRVFDFGRDGLDGRPRELHVEASIASIDWDDVEPSLHAGGGPLAQDACFTVRRERLDAPSVLTASGECAIVTVVDGAAACDGRTFGVGSLFLLPATGGELPVGPAEGDAVTVLVTELPG